MGVSGMFLFHLSVRKVGELLSFLAHCNFTVVPVCDGERSDTKLDSYKRRRDALKGRINSEKARALLYKSRTNQTDLTSSEEVSELNKKAKKRSRPSMKNSFPDDLQAWLHSNGSLQEHKSGGKVENVCVTRWQADPHIAKEYLDKRAAIILSSDTDFLMYVGKNVMLINAYYLKRGRVSQKNKAYENMNIASIEVSFASNEVLLNACVLVNERRAADLSFKKNKANDIVTREAKHDLFGRTEFDSPVTRALIGIGVGCDVRPGGIKGVGTSFFGRLKKKKGQDLTVPLDTRVCVVTSATQYSVEREQAHMK